MNVAEKLIGDEISISEKSLQFALRIVNFYKYSITKNRSVEILLKQVLKSGTSIGANVAESKNAVSKPDFINKLSIAFKRNKRNRILVKTSLRKQIYSNKKN